ncbi:MAG: hypothetical protein A3J09_02675 [Candidatus Zambryskibacteria bacterium RIFCSPLOWO2_02_FULL_51_21]|uniref:SMODS and SLOG-associating 2TM effector domain-containing protein n=1 Tax=Candidatus Zambryskibacteria bacterium RIFCSPHIGHO2_02_FULL_43_37 TaxID=1802749 RepID=A0A1G2TG97_9BACT|nr:MAG: hypothetical protein A3D49_00225 [Candidatus Zambryskibacteria bacterium RIFCSPHIGHO2_02_FULL_43_37]OHB07718.1 MAG: hypothetical protein A2944_00100 [Candidatus Zambryskibacteria bacterium RIFCSPLOWO2_01_FULL_52_12]OHB11426.1 MAG: hypothetical protein A3J09_02675 [Candidatus Zambryskibacteria bacterium RIFCSPLOWO2_02_FULL_51_21]
MAFHHKEPEGEQADSHEIALQLDNYDDLFSVFDNRPYSKRALSVDFLDEVRRASLDKSDEKLELVISMPKELRSEAHDQTIKERLSDHFHKHYKRLQVEKRRIMRLGFLMVFLGLVSMVGATFVISKNSDAQSFGYSFLLILLEPAAWFLLWEGMDQIIFNSQSLKHDLEFYRKMSLSHERVHFQSY